MKNALLALMATLFLTQFLQAQIPEDKGDYFNPDTIKIDNSFTAMGYQLYKKYGLFFGRDSVEIVAGQNVFVVIEGITGFTLPSRESMEEISITVPTKNFSVEFFYLKRYGIFGRKCKIENQKFFVRK